jgi:hypothetical protein
MGAVAGHRDGRALGQDAAPGRLDPGAAPLLDDESGGLAILDDVDAEGIRRPGVAPGHRVMARRAGTSLQQPAPDGKARVGRKIEIGQKLHHLAAIEELGVDAVEAHDIALARQDIELRGPMGEHALAALRQHDVEVEGVGQPLPQLQGELEELGIAVDHVVRAHDGGVAPDIAGADIAALDHGDIGHAVIGGEVIGGRQPMAAAPDDHRVIAGLGRRRAPGPGPGQIGIEGVTGEGEGGIALGQGRESGGIRGPDWDSRPLDCQ